MVKPEKGQVSKLKEVVPELLLRGFERSLTMEFQYDDLVKNNEICETAKEASGPHHGAVDMHVSAGEALVARDDADQRRQQPWCFAARGMTERERERERVALSLSQGCGSQPSK